VTVPSSNWQHGKNIQHPVDVQSSDTSIKGFHDGSPRITLKGEGGYAQAGPDALRQKRAAHFSVRPQGDNLGYERAGQDRVRRRGQSHQTFNDLLLAASRLSAWQNFNRLSCSGASGKPIMTG
jgi:hypothetical protein